MDFSDSVDLYIDQSSGLSNIENSIILWLDASNIDATNNSSITKGNTIENWVDLSGN